MSSPRQLYQASMAEFHAIGEWWDEMSREERRIAIPRVEPLFWMFLTGIEQWTVVRDAINGGIAAVSDQEAA